MQFLCEIMMDHTSGRCYMDGVFMLLRPGCGEPPPCTPRPSRLGEIGASRPPGGEGDMEP
jgi:hypothetical protein